MPGLYSGMGDLNSAAKVSSPTHTEEAATFSLFGSR
jgi:hypothetical protein